MLWWIGLAGAVTADQRHLRFQSLLWWIGLAGADGSPAVPSSSVSILVVVDRARWDMPVGSRPTTCFNPCCGGSGSLGASRACMSRLARSFNPCCGGSGSLGPIGIAGQLVRCGVFQSLLWWIGLAGRRERGRIVRERRFQSLLWWIGLAGPRDRRRSAVHARGVSILVVVDRARWGRSPKTTAQADGDVSILVVVDRARWDAIEAPQAQAAGGCFNPCCGGSGSLGRRAGSSHADAVDVSILVVVDRARWGSSRPLQPAGAEVSILVVVDRARWGGRCVGTQRR